MTAFKIGDRVRLTEPMDELDVGEAGTVTMIDPYPYYELRVKFDNEVFTEQDESFAQFFPEMRIGVLIREHEVELV